jgi:beta-glucanase (GH16 family)
MFMRAVLLASVGFIPLAATAQTARHHHHHWWQHHQQELQSQQIDQAVPPLTEQQILSFLLPWLQTVDPNLAAEIAAAPVMTENTPAPTTPTPPILAPLEQLPANNAAPQAVSPDAFTAAAGTPPPATRSPITLAATTPTSNFPSIAPPPAITPGAVTPTPSTTTPLDLAPFAANNCPGETLFADFSNGIGQWSVGGGGSLSDGNDAFASYQAPTQNASVTTAPGSGLTLNIVPAAAPQGKQWYAGLINSQNFFSQTYGYWEVIYNVPSSMKQPGASWAAWLLGYQWPPEIDMVEMYGATMDAAVHSSDPDFKPGPNGEPPRKQTNYNPLGVASPFLDQYGSNYNFPAGDHVSSTAWDANKISIYLDSLLIAQSDTPKDFNQPMYIVLSSAATNAMQPGASASVTVKQVRVFKDKAAADACVPQQTAPVALSR